MTWLETIYSFSSLQKQKTERNFTQQKQKRNFLKDKKRKYQSFLYSFSVSQQPSQPDKTADEGEKARTRCLCFVSFSHNHVNCFILQNYSREMKVIKT